MRGRISLVSVLALFMLALRATVWAQDLVKDALASFPLQTIRVEYSRPAKLRALPDYTNLRQQYIGPRLQRLEASFGQLGISEGDIDEVVLGWQPSAAEMELYGLAWGRFSAASVADRASAQGLSPTTVAGLPVYCLAPTVSAPCVAILGESRGAFGSLGLLSSMLEARSGQASSLGSDARFVQLISRVAAQAPIWGISVGPAVADWFRGWMPTQGNVALDWSRMFQGVDSLAYSVDVGTKVHLDMELDCATPEDATRLTQLLEGLRVAQQVAWQNQNPNRPNPFGTMEVALNGRQISLRVTTEYAALHGALSSAAP